MRQMAGAPICLLICCQKSILELQSGGFFKVNCFQPVSNLGAEVDVQMIHQLATSNIVAKSERWFLPLASYCKMPPYGIIGTAYKAARGTKRQQCPLQECAKEGVTYLHFCLSYGKL